MNFLPMDYYLAVAEEKSISRAARRLHITQQTLSAHMAALEKELGCRLFQRRPRFSLTYAGRVFRSYAERFGGLYRAMEQEFADIARREAGELSVGVAPARGRFLLGPLLSAFRKSHPRIRLQLVETSNDDLIARLLADRVDLIFANLTEDHPLVVSRPFFREEMMLLVPAGLLTGRDRARLEAGDYRPLADIPFLMNRQEDIAGRIGSAFLEAWGIVPRVAVSSENMETLLDLCLAGEGACFCSRELSDRSFADRDDSGLLRIPLGARFAIRLAWLKKPYTKKALSDFVALCAGESPEK